MKKNIQQQQQRQQKQQRSSFGLHTDSTAAVESNRELSLGYTSLIQLERSHIRIETWENKGKTKTERRKKNELDLCERCSVHISVGVTCFASQRHRQKRTYSFWLGASWAKEIFFVIAVSTNGEGKHTEFFTFMRFDCRSLLVNGDFHRNERREKKSLWCFHLTLAGYVKGNAEANVKMPHGMDLKKWTRRAIRFIPKRTVWIFFCLSFPFDSIRYDLINNRLAKGRLNRMHVQPCIVFGWHFMCTPTHAHSDWVKARLELAHINTHTNTININLTLFVHPLVECYKFLSTCQPQNAKCIIHFPHFSAKIQMRSYRQMKTWNNSPAHPCS